MLITLSNKYFRLKTENYAIYIGVNDYDQIFYKIDGLRKLNSSFILHNLSKEEESEMRNEMGVELYEHQLEYVEFDRDTLKFTKRLENDNLLIEDDPVSLNASSLNFYMTKSYKNPWKNLLKIRKIKNLL
jgi:hypothetical protein